MTSSTTPVAVAGLSCPVEAGGLYTLEAVLPFTATVFNGGTVGVTAPGGSKFAGEAYFGLSGQSFAPRAISEAYPSASAASSIGLGTTCSVRVTLGYLLAGAAGSVELTFAAVSGATVTIQAGATLRYRRLN